MTSSDDDEAIGALIWKSSRAATRNAEEEAFSSASKQRRNDRKGGVGESGPSQTRSRRKKLKISIPADEHSSYCKTVQKEEVKRCSHGGCTNQVIKGGICKNHLANKKSPLCSGNNAARCTTEKCTNKSIARGLCRRHGAPVKKCTHEGCANFAKIGGVCRRHGAPAKKCTHGGCANNAVIGGVCNRHGAKTKRCTHDGCTNNAIMGGVCRRHGAGTLQSQQKWDDMFECLVNFIDETREKLTNHMNEEQKAAWIWDGNVPTSYKTPCGKALGRWINNQRSAKAKGTLKDEREVRLVSTGLKWSVLTTNSWRIMLHKLEIYVNEQTKDGQTWDGNVPTNYKIKSNFPGAPVSELDEEKNLGRWVNRQRSLFQSGKLKKDRQMDLERIGLKWSVRLTTSWSTMYENLCAYAEEKRKQSPHGWDGNVPANFKTRSNPPLSLGRWVNRQRSAHAKGRLKDEYVKKLDVVGLKWVIHARGNRPNDDDDDDFVGGEFIPSSSIQKSSIAPLNGATTTQGSAISNAGLPSLPPLGNSFASNAQAP